MTKVNFFFKFNNEMRFETEKLFCCPRCGDTFLAKEGGIMKQRIPNSNLVSVKYEAACPFCMELATRYETNELDY